MSWTTPTIRATGYLVTASDWNTDIVNNLAYLKGEAGLDIEFEDDIVPAASERCGLSTAPWSEGHFDKLYAGPRYALHRFVRELIINWESDAFGTYNLNPGTPGAGGSVDMGGLGQCVLGITDNASGSAYFEPIPEQNSALDVSFNASRSPYYRQEFAVDANRSNASAFIGLRQTPGSQPPVSASEHAFGLVWTGAIWQFQSMNASTVDASGTQSISVNTRYVVEMLLIAGTSVECYLNGVLVDTLTVVPTGDLEWSCLFESDGGGGATTAHLTLGKAILQEDLA